MTTEDTFVPHHPDRREIYSILSHLQVYSVIILKPSRWLDEISFSHLDLPLETVARKSYVNRGEVRMIWLL